MENKKEKVALNDELLDKVAGGTDWKGTTCPKCGNAPKIASLDYNEAGQRIWVTTCFWGHTYTVLV